MSSRGLLFIIAAFLSMVGWLPGRAADPVVPQPASPAVTAPATPPVSPRPSGNQPSRGKITYGPYTVQADDISLHLSTGIIDAVGNVEVTGKGGVVRAARGMFNQKNNTGMLETISGDRPPFRFTAQTATIDQQNVQHLHHSTITTCNEEHPHYQILSRDVTVTPEGGFDARHDTMEINGWKLMSIPYIRGSFSNTQEFFVPSATVGYNRIDGAYYGNDYLFPLGHHGATVSLEGRFGTNGVLRGGAYLDQPFQLAHQKIKGKITLVTSYRSDVENNMLRIDSSVNNTLKQLTLSRLPAVQMVVDPFQLPGTGGFSLRMGASVGIYHEHPTDVQDRRLQGWGVLASPALRLGSVAQFRAEFGLRRSVYQDKEAMTTDALQVTLESPPAKNFYYNLSYLRRDSTGSTPFFFDRVLIPEELYAETEFPLTKKGDWRVDVFDRYDLQTNKTRSSGITLIYSLDCISYGLLFSPTTHAFGLGVAINAFGSFRRGVKDIAFPQ